jgi:hypothetical protein
MAGMLRTCNEPSYPTKPKSWRLLAVNLLVLAVAKCKNKAGGFLKTHKWGGVISHALHPNRTIPITIQVP